MTGQHRSTGLRWLSQLAACLLLVWLGVACYSNAPAAESTLVEPTPAGATSSGPGATEAAAPVEPGTPTEAGAPGPSSDRTAVDAPATPELATASATAVSPIEPGPTDGEPNDAPISYRVKYGDTLWDIAIAHGVSLDAVIAANGIDDPNNLWAGRELIIPGGRAPVTTAANPTPAPTAARLALPPDDIPARPTPAEQPDFPPLPPLPQQALLEPMLHDWQKLNNCAPTTVAMALSYYDVLVTQFDAAPVLKGGPNDKNVSPTEMVPYLHDQGFGARLAVNGDIETLEQLINHGIPVIVEQWLDRPGEPLTGHYRLVRGFDQTAAEIIVNDSYSGPKLHFSYAEFDRLWRAFNRVYIPVYLPDQETTVRAILGPDWDTASMYRRAAERASAEIEADADVYAWFNLGTSLLQLGEYDAAATAYDQAISIGLPSRMLWYQFGPLEAYNQTGRYEDVLEVSAPLTGLALEELHYQRGVAFEGLGQRNMAVAEYQRAADLNPNLGKAAESVARLRGQPSTGG